MKYRLTLSDKKYNGFYYDIEGYNPTKFIIYPLLGARTLYFMIHQNKKDMIIYKQITSKEYKLLK